MRKILFSLLAFSAVGTAQAADLDYDYLRGADYDPPSSTLIDWSGVYVGGHGGWSTGKLINNGSIPSTLASYANATLSTSTYSATSNGLYGSRGPHESFGAFAGYNAQFDDVVLGVEADYTHNGRKELWSGVAVSSGALSPVVSSYRTSFENYGTIRARAGYAVGSFLPFVTGGLAIGEANTSQKLYSAASLSVPSAQATTSKIVTGVAAGVGIDYAITPNVLLRAEYQYLNFPDFVGRKVQINTFRGGAAVKF